MSAKIVYNNEKDKEFLDKINLEIPFFVQYIDINTRKGKKEGWKLMNYYGDHFIMMCLLMGLVHYKDI